MKKATRFLALVLCMAMLVSSAQIALAQQDWEKDTTPITFSCYTNDASIKPWGEDQISKKITEVTGVSLDIRIPVQNEEMESLSLMMASGEFPDILFLNANNQGIDDLVEEGYLLNLDELMAKEAPNLEHIMDTYHGSELLDNYRAADGNNYYMYYGYNSEIANAQLKEMGLLYPVWLVTFVTRQDWLDEIGNPDMSSPELFKSALLKMKEKHPDADGLVMDSMDSFFYQFGVWDNVGWQGQGVDVDGNIVHQIRRDSYKNALAYANDLARSGLLTKEGFMNPFDINNAKFINGEAIAMRDNYYSFTNVVEVQDTVKVPVKPFDTYGFSFQYSPWRSIAITKNCKDPARAIQFIEYLASNEGQLMMGYGIEGEKGAWTGNADEGPYFYFDSEIKSPFFKQGKPVIYEEFQAERSIDFNAYAKRTGINNHTYMQNWAFNNWNIWEWKGASPEFTAYTEMMADHITFKPEFIFKLIPDSKAGIASAKVKSIVEEYELRIVFAQDDAEFEQLLSEMIQKADQAGLKTLEEEWTAQYRANLAKLGK